MMATVCVCVCVFGEQSIGVCHLAQTARQQQQKRNEKYTQKLFEISPHGI